MTPVDLKAASEYLDQYVALRNYWHELLLTEPVNLDGTREWLKRDDIEVRGLVEGKILMGIVILYVG